RGVPRSAASRIEASVIATGAMIVEVRGTWGSGGNSTSTGALPPPGDSQSMALRLTKNETAITATAIKIVLRRIVPPGQLPAESTAVRRVGKAGGRERVRCVPT